MTTTNPSLSISIFILSLLLITPPHPTSSLPLSFTQLRTAISLSHSLFTRISNLRTARGDLHGARRAKLIASKLDHGLLGLGSWPTMWSMGWDYFKNYAWSGGSGISFRDAVGLGSDANELMGLVNELGKLRSDKQRATWVAQNYGSVLRVSKSLFRRLSTIFVKTGPMKEMVETMRKELEGDLIKDCLEVGTNDLKGLVQILKDLASQYTSNVDDHQEL